MTSQINYSAIDATYPVAGQNNDTQGFRDNFAATKTALETANSEITNLQINSAVLNSSNNFGGNQIYNAEFKYNSQTVYDHGTISGNVILNCRNGQVQKLVTSGNVTLSFSNWPLTNKMGSILLFITLGSGSHTITYPGSVEFPPNWIEPISSGTYLLEFTTTNSGTTIYLSNKIGGNEINLTATVFDLDAMKDLTSRPGSVVVQSGQAAGVWQWVAGSTTTADDALVVTCTSGASGRYKRVYSGSKDAKWYGAVGDGVADDTAALQAWYAAGGALVISEGTYNITAVLSTAVSTKLRGVGKVTIVTGAAMTTAAIRAWADDCSIEKINIDASASTNMLDGIHIAGHRYVVRDVSVTGGNYKAWLPGTYPGPYYNLRIAGPSSTYVMYEDGIIDNYSTVGGNTGLYVQGGRRLQYSNIRVFRCAGFGAIVGGGISVQNFQLVNFEAVSCGMYGFSNSAQFGATGVDPRAMTDWTIINAMVSYCGWRSALDGKYGAIGAGKFGYDITDGSLDGFYFRGAARDCCVGGFELKGADFATAYYDETLVTSAQTTSGTTLTFADTATVYVGMAVAGVNIPADTYIASKTSTTVVLTRAVSGTVLNAASIVFTTGLIPSGHKNANVDFNYISTTGSANYSQTGLYALLEDSTSDQYFAEKHKLKTFSTTKQAVTWRSNLRRQPYEIMASNGLSWLCMGAVANGQEGTTGQTAPSASGIYVYRATNAVQPSSAVLKFASVANISPGMLVLGANVPDGTYVQSVDGGALTVTLTQATTGSGVANGANIIIASLESDGTMYWMCLGPDTSGLVSNTNV